MQAVAALDSLAAKPLPLELPSRPYYRARYYDSSSGRFLSEDPVGLAGGINVYAYGGNTPVDAVDPTGLAYNIIQESNGDIFVQVSITVYGNTATPELAKKWQKDILERWNGHTWNGCRVLFQVYIQNDPNHDWWFTAAQSDNMISVVDSDRALVPRTMNGWPWYGYWWNKSSPTSIAHEFGHLLGLDDHYDQKTLKPDPGWEGDIMGMDPYVTSRSLNQVIKGRACGCK